MKILLKNLINYLRILFFYFKYYRFKNISSKSRISRNVCVYNKKNLILEDNASIGKDAIIMNTRAKFIMKYNSGSAIGLLVITGNHLNIIGKFFKQITDRDKDIHKNTKLDKDIIVEEDVWIGANVTLLVGAHIKRGAIIGAGSVVRNVVPPYSIIIGNPAKIIGFKFTPNEIIENEKLLYPEKERIPKDILINNYNKYFLSKIKEINNFMKL